MNIKWLGHSSFQITNSVVIYIDPWQLKLTTPADIILVTHAHYDHFSIQDIKKIRKEDSALVLPKDCSIDGTANVHFVVPGQTLSIKGIKIEATAAYNIGKRYHPQQNNWVGYIVTIDNTTIYHAGDTDIIPEMNKIKNIDFALLPIGGTYTMNAQEAAVLADTIRPKIVIPMHYGSIVGTLADAQEFRKHCKNTQVQIKEGKNG